MLNLFARLFLISIYFPLLGCFRYRITEGVNLPFRVLPTIKELGRTRMEVNVKVVPSTDSLVTPNISSFLYFFLVTKAINQILLCRSRVCLVQKCLLLEL